MVQCAHTYPFRRHRAFDNGRVFWGSFVNLGIASVLSFRIIYDVSNVDFQFYVAESYGTYWRPSESLLLAQPRPLNNIRSAIFATE